MDKYLNSTFSKFLWCCSEFAWVFFSALEAIFENIFSPKGWYMNYKIEIINLILAFTEAHIDNFHVPKSHSVDFLKVISELLGRCYGIFFRLWRKYWMYFPLNKRLIKYLWNWNCSQILGLQRVSLGQCQGQKKRVLVACTELFESALGNVCAFFRNIEGLVSGSMFGIKHL